MELLGVRGMSKSYSVNAGMRLKHDNDRLIAENEALREEVERLRALLEDQQKWIDHIASERDQLKAAVALSIDTFEQYQMDVDTYPPPYQTCSADAEPERSFSQA